MDGKHGNCEDYDYVIYINSKLCRICSLIKYGHTNRNEIKLSTLEGKEIFVLLC